MNQVTYEDVLVDKDDFFTESSYVEKSTRIEEFYKQEEWLLHHLFNLEKTKAKESIRLVIDDVIGFSDGQELQGLKNYFISFSGMVSRKMLQSEIPAEKAFFFNTTCNELIEEKLSAENAVDLADELIEFLIYSIEEKSSPTLPHQTVNAVIHYIDEQVQAPLSVEGLAQMFGVSTSHLSRIFREHTGITLVEYINIKKVEESQYYLRFSNQKISDISDNFNFCNQSYYTRIFKKYTGYTPRKFRNNMTGCYFRFTLPQERQFIDEE